MRFFVTTEFTVINAVTFPPQKLTLCCSWKRQQTQIVTGVKFNLKACFPGCKVLKLSTTNRICYWKLCSSWTVRFYVCTTFVQFCCIKLKYITGWGRCEYWPTDGTTWTKERFILWETWMSKQHFKKIHLLTKWPQTCWVLTNWQGTIHVHGSTTQA